MKRYLLSICMCCMFVFPGLANASIEIDGGATYEDGTTFDFTASVIPMFGLHSRTLSLARMYFIRVILCWNHSISNSHYLGW